MLKTPHFDVYYYDSEREAAEQASRMAERWYARLSRIMNHELGGRQPLILYASHPDFEQTNAIQGELGEGTGGVTEVLKRRIVLPLGGSLSETDHVIGHELVHAFQFDITRRGHGGSGMAVPTAVYLPLWFIEGMAEYLSLGPVDPHTAMWLRDAAQINKLPSIRKLSDPRYFPYRYGQAFWAYVGGRWGDEAIGRILKATDKNGDVRPVFLKVLGESPDSLSRDWHRAIREWNAPIAAVTSTASKAARRLIGAQGSRGRLNLSPALSPDGRQLMFLSERDLFSIELYLADANTGRILRRVTRTAVDPHLQSLEFIQSAGEWSPDGKRFAFSAVVDGTPVLRVIDVASGHIDREIRLADMGEIFSPTWSPDGRRIALSAMSGGVTDLFMLDLETRQIKRLTDDLFADLAPAWSPDGSRIAFVTDRFSTRIDGLIYGRERIALIDPESGAVEPVRGTAAGKNISPQWSRDGKTLYFVSDRNGVSNLYRLTLAGGEVEQLTNLLTGVSGITRLSPAVSVARDADRAVFSAYEAGSYNLYTLDRLATLGGVPPSPLDDTAVATLPPLKRESDELERLIADHTLGLSDTVVFKHAKYRAGLSLDVVSTTGVGIAAGSNGVGAGGGTALFWSDMLGNHNLLTLVQLNNAGGSTVNNLAAVVAYQNLKSRWNWGVGFDQLPYVSRQFETEDGVDNGVPVLFERDFRFWQIERDVEGSVAYPFSRVQRVEFAVGYRNISFINEVRTREFSEVTGDLLSDDTQRLPGNIPTLHLVTNDAALVYDSSIFGGTSPILGQSYRFEVAPVFGDLQYTAALADYRRYVMLARPLTLAGRVLHFGRYGKDGEDQRLSDLFLGSPWLIHGYDDASFTLDECSFDPANPQACPEFDRLLGSRLAVANLELRMPLFGAVGLVPSPSVPPLEAAAFYDAGVAWRSNDEPRFLGGHHKGVTSYGGALRLNVFGLAVAEVALVHPDDRPMKGWYWEFNLQQGF